MRCVSEAPLGHGQIPCGPATLPFLTASQLSFVSQVQLPRLAEDRDGLQCQQHHIVARRAPLPLSLLLTLTCDSFAAGGVVRFELVALYAQALVAPQSVDALLAAGVGGGALVDVNARLPIVLQPEPRTASTLQEATRSC